MKKFWRTKTEAKIKHLLNYLNKIHPATLEPEQLDCINEIMAFIENNDHAEAICLFEYSLDKQFKATFKLAWRQKDHKDNKVQNVKITAELLAQISDNRLITELYRRGLEPIPLDNKKKKND